MLFRSVYLNKEHADGLNRKQARESWARYSASIVEELNRATGMIKQLDEDLAAEWIKTYTPRRCKRKRG